jgi:hypothetical protein
LHESGAELRCAARRLQSTIKSMAKAQKFGLETSGPMIDEEDEETLAAIDEGIRDMKSCRTVPVEEIRRRLPEWSTEV